ncbi:MAG: hypothetical protein AAGD25_07345 [Cyanobacteria bacterium P01_F01_bin.150]
MAYVRFRNLPAKNARQLTNFFDYVRTAKAEERLDADQIASILGDIVATNFWHPTPEELLDWQKRWESTPVERRFTDPTLKTPWEFESWVDAIENAEIAYVRITLDDDGSGTIEYEQLAIPSGGLDATKQIAKMFGATVTETDHL